VLANEFICSRFAALVGAPVPEVMLVEVPDDLLDEARLAAACPSSFMGGIHAGAVVLSGAEAVPISKIESTVRSVVNAADWAALEIFDQIVKRDDKIEIITYRKLDGRRYFASIDYGFSFGGTPDWDRESLQGLDEPFLRYEGTALCRQQEGMIAKLGELAPAMLLRVIEELALPRFGITADLADALARCVEARSQFLAAEYERLCR